MYVQIIVGAGLALLLILCLPIATIQKLVLEVYALALRLALLAVVGAGAYLSFFPDRLPPEVTDSLASFPQLSRILPTPGTPHFGACAAGLVVVVLLPFLAMLDVTRKLAGRRLSRLRALSAGRVVEAPPPAAAVQTPAAPPPVPPPAPKEVTSAPRPTDRRAAADTLAAVGSRKPFRYTGPEREDTSPSGTRRSE